MYKSVITTQALVKGCVRNDVYCVGKYVVKHRVSGTWYFV